MGTTNRDHSKMVRTADPTDFPMFLSHGEPEGIRMNLRAGHDMVMTDNPCEPAW